MATRRTTSPTTADAERASQYATRPDSQKWLPGRCDFTDGAERGNEVRCTDREGL